jgi:ATP-dependent Clp protease ATP-binding subunit ClpA
VLVLAREEARLLGHPYIGTEHILLGLIAEGEGIAASALGSLGISLEAVREKVEEAIGPAVDTAAGGSPPFTPRAKKVLELALREALQLGHNYIGTEHMLLGLVREGEGVAAQVLLSLGDDLSRIRQVVIQLLSGYASREKAVAGAAREHSFAREVMQVGASWRLEVVWPGRTPEAFEAASRQLTEMFNRLEGPEGGELDTSAVLVRSVETEEGPGLQLTVNGPAPVAPTAGPEVPAEGGAPSAGAPGSGDRKTDEPAAEPGGQGGDG